MKPKISLITHLIVVSAIVLGGVFAFPAQGVFAQTTSSLTPAQQRLAVRLGSQYAQIKNDLNSLSGGFNQAAADRSAYVSFLNAQQALGKDVASLNTSLSIFDSYISQGSTARQDGIFALDENTGFDSSGNVVDILAVGNEIQSALAYDSTARNFLIRAVNQLHGALNLYFQVTGVSVPNIPKLRLTAFAFTPLTPAPAPTLTPAQIRLAGRTGQRYVQIKADLVSLNTQFAQVATYRTAYANFLATQQASSRDTTMLSNNLSAFDSFVNIATTDQQNGIFALDEATGFGSNGNVIDIFAVGNEVQTALGYDAMAHTYLVLAVYDLHSALNLYYQIWGVSVPNIPKLRLTPFSFISSS